MDWPQLLSIVLVFSAIGTLYIAGNAKYFTIREHDEFRNTLFRELDILLNRVKILEQTNTNLKG